MDSHFRRNYEIIEDKLIILLLTQKNRRKGNSIEGTNFQRHVKLQKLLYHLESRLFLKKIKALNYTFYLWDYGPFSRPIYSDVDDLEKTSLLTINRITDYRGELLITEKGNELLKNIDDILLPDKILFNYLDKVINEFGEYKWDEIKKITYAYPSPAQKVPIKELKKGDLILPKLNEKESLNIIRINEEWLDTLEILFNPKLYETLNNSIELIRRDSKGKSLEELFKDIM